ncbi:pilin [Patescibacteria group bacterium]|nr:pilin [Patescibacteria group bacterium]
MSNALKNTKSRSELRSTTGGKYLILMMTVLLAGFIFSSAQVVFAEGDVCGVSGEGICRISCASYDDVDYNDTNCPSNELGQVSRGSGTISHRYETCCIPTKCGSNYVGGGVCKSSGSCGSGSVSINTSDCAPPKVCCAYSRASETPSWNDSIFPNDEENIFTGEKDVLGEYSDETEGKGLVPDCEGVNCSLCDLFQLIKNIINFLTKVVFALATAFIVWGAIEIMIAGGSETRITSGRGRITTAIFGIVITLGAWLLIGTILQVLTGSSSKLPWNEIECSSEPIGARALPKSEEGNNFACISQGGTCQNIKTTTCEGDNWKPNLCLSSEYKKDFNIKCCIPLKKDSNKEDSKFSHDPSSCKNLGGECKSDCDFPSVILSTNKEVCSVGVCCNVAKE